MNITKLIGAISLAGMLVCVHVCAIAAGGAPIMRMPGRDAPTLAGKSTTVTSVGTLEALPIASWVSLPAPTSLELFNRRAGKTVDAIGFGRLPPAEGAGSKRIDVTSGQDQIRIRVTSPTAKHLRAGLILEATSSYTVWAWAPGDGLPVSLEVAPGRSNDLVWTPLTIGETQEVVVRRTSTSGTPWSLAIGRVSHVEVGLGDPPTALNPKSFGDSAFCQFDLACLLPALNTNEQNIVLGASRAVALMVTTDAFGSTYSCTGTLLNSANYPAPILITANHCVDNANSLLTIWFFSRTDCGFGLPSPASQVTGGGTILWRSATLDGALILLEQQPPAAAGYAGWDANSVNARTLSLAIHHPRGDVKKASFGDIIGSNPSPVSIGTVSYGPGVFYLVDWEVGIVEHGSSGSGLFTYDDSLTSMTLRATLTGGNATCSNGSKSRTYYSQLYNAYPYIRDALTVAYKANYQGLWWKAPAGSESGWGINLAHQGDVIFATWFTYDQTGKAWWLSMTANKTAANTYSGTLYETTGPAWYATPFNPALVKAVPVGTGQLTFADENNGIFAYAVQGITQTKMITRQAFGPVPSCTFGAQSNLALATNEQDLWWNDPPGSEAGWGINLTHQGNIIFATWFTYNGDGTPLWFSVTANQTSPGTYTGTLYGTSGPAFNSSPFSPANVKANVAGSATFRFVNGNRATFTNTVNASSGPITQTKNITRQVFRPPGTICK